MCQGHSHFKAFAQAIPFLAKLTNPHPCLCPKSFMKPLSPSCLLVDFLPSCFLILCHLSDLYGHNRTLVMSQPCSKTFSGSPPPTDQSLSIKFFLAMPSWSLNIVSSSVSSLGLTQINILGSPDVLLSSLLWIFLLPCLNAWNFHSQPPMSESFKPLPRSLSP